jgi:hypothetical protein
LLITDFELSITDLDKQLNAFLSSLAELPTVNTFLNSNLLASFNASFPKLMNAVVISLLFKSLILSFASLN